jgi:hypothetical protein
MGGSAFSRGRALAVRQVRDPELGGIASSRSVVRAAHTGQIECLAILDDADLVAAREDARPPSGHIRHEDEDDLFPQPQRS